MGSKNRQGLYPLSQLKSEKYNQLRLQIRQDSYFGCVVCGNALYDYEHIDPEFKEASEHDPSKMCLLCPNHNQKSERGERLNKDVIKQWQKNPFCKKYNSWHYKIESLLFNENINVKIGGLEFINCEKIIEFNGINILSILKPEMKDSPYRINGNFYNLKGDKILEINNNQLFGSIKNFDVHSKKSEIKILNDGACNLKIEEIGTNKFEITELDFVLFNSRILLYNKNLYFINNKTKSAYIWGDGTYLKNMQAGICINNGKMIVGQARNDLEENEKSITSLSFFGSININLMPNLLIAKPEVVIKYLSYNISIYRFPILF